MWIKRRFARVFQIGEIALFVRVVSRSKPPHMHNADDSLSLCGGLPSGESTLQL